MEYTIEIDGDVFVLEDNNGIDAVQITESKFHLLENNQSYNIEVIQSNFASKTITLEVNGNTYQVLIKDSHDGLAKKLGFASINSLKFKEVKAPMPGLIVEVLVEIGQEIEKGDQLLVLEAMKMENVLLAEGEGIVKSVNFNKGTAVDKGQVIIELE